MSSQSGEQTGEQTEAENGTEATATVWGTDGRGRVWQPEPTAPETTLGEGGGCHLL